MKMIFKQKNKQVLLQSAGGKGLFTISLAICLCMQPLYADVTAKNIEHNGKVVTKVLPSKQALDASRMNPEKKVSAKSQREIVQLHAEQWELTRSGESVLSLPVLNQLINKWLSEKNKVIEIQYPGGEEGEFWVQELTDWMVSLGIPSNHMVVVPGSGADDVIKFALIK